VRAGVLERERLDEAMETAGGADVDLGEHLVRQGLVNETAMLQAISRALNLPTVSLADLTPDERALGLVPRELCVEYTLFPIELESTRGGDHLHVAMSNPSDVRAIKQVTRKARRRIRPLVATAREIRQAIALHYGGTAAQVSPSAAMAAPAASGSPVDMFDFDVTDLSSSDGGLSSLGGGPGDGAGAAGRSSRGLEAVDLGGLGHGNSDFNPFEQDHRPPVRAPGARAPVTGPQAVAQPALPAQTAAQPAAPRGPVRAPAVPLYSSPPVPAAAEDVFEHSMFRDARSQPAMRSAPVAPSDRGGDRSPPAPSGLFEHSERTLGGGRAQPPRPAPAAPPRPGAPPSRDAMQRDPAPTSRPPRPGPPVSLAPLPVAPPRGAPPPMGASKPLGPSVPRGASLPSAPSAPMQAEDPAVTEGAGMMIRKRRRGGEVEPVSQISSPAPAFPITPMPPGRGPENPTPADGIDIRKLFERIDARDEDLAAGDVVIGRYLERYGAAAQPPAPDEFLHALERAVGRAGSPTARLLLVLVRRLARDGLLDPEDLLADLTRR